MPGRQIADELGVSEDIVVMMRIRHDIVGVKGARHDVRLSAEKRSIIAKLTHEGRSDREIAEAIGVRYPSTVARHRASYSLPSPRRDLGLDVRVVAIIIAEHRRGSTMAQAATLIGVHQSTIARLFRRQQWTWGQANKGRSQVSGSLNQDAIAAALATGMTPSLVAEELGVSRALVSRVIRRRGIVAHSDIWTPERRREQISPFVQQGLSVVDIARKIDLSDRQVAKICKRYDLKPADGRKRRK
jgi:transposase